MHIRIGEKEVLIAMLLDASLLSSSFYLPSNMTMCFPRFSYVYGPFTNESVVIVRECDAIMHST